MNVLKGCGLAAVALMTAATARGADVQTPDRSGFELGVGVGQGTFQVSIPGVGSGSESHLGFNVFGGYRFDRYVSIEAGFLDGGQYHASGSDDDGDTASLSLHLRAAQLSAVGTLPIGDYFALYARAGVDRWWLGTDVAINDEVSSETFTSTRFMYGGGAEVFWEGAAIRVEYQQSKADNLNIEGIPVDLRHQYIAASIVWQF
jgi:Outer membrane protein beta-barrel domain